MTAISSGCTRPTQDQNLPKHRPSQAPFDGRRPDRVLRTVGRALRVAARSTRALGRGYVAAVRRAVHLIGHELFTAEEILRLGLLDPALGPGELRQFMSRVAMTRLQQRLNPVAWRTLAEDKGIFYRTCAAHGLPIPQLCALFLGDQVGWTHQGPAPDTRDAWASFLESACPAEIVVKPCFGGYGVGRCVLSGGTLPSPRPDRSWWKPTGIPTRPTRTGTCTCCGRRFNDWPERQMASGQTALGSGCTQGLR
jgi:hypothetical protein